MRELEPSKNAQPTIRKIVSADRGDFIAFAVLISDVFGIDAEAPPWPAVAAFDGAGRCVAGLQHTVLDIGSETERVRYAAIRNVAVLPAWRGRGLSRRLFETLLPWCDAVAAISLLYAETPTIYERFGFRPLAQHAFEGEAPRPDGPATARRIRPEDDRAPIDRLLSARTPVSNRVAVIDDGGLTAHALRREDRTLFYDPSLDVVVVVEENGAILVLADVIGARVPSAARILGALGARPARLRTLFPPDRLAWSGAPVPDDAGLMIRGPVPEFLRAPFILPPTVEF